MKILFLQIGDIHFKQGANSASERFPFVVRALKHLAPDLTTVVVALSGDIAYSGKKPEYDVADACLCTPEELMGN